jgi:CelD/BcsL family acetyltransferase involved in cellulose biosynthesis
VRVAREPVAVEVVEEAGALDRLRDEWTALLACSAAPEIFLTWEWLATWWKHLGGERRLRIVEVRRAGELIALAPWALRRPRIRRLVPFAALEFLGTGVVGSDYLDVIVRPGAEEAALEALGRWLRAQGLVLELAQLASGATWAGRLAARLERDGWRLRREETHRCPYIPIAGQTWESYLAGLGAEHRYGVRRKLRRLERSGEVCFERVCTEAARREAFGHLLRLHESRWRPRGGSDAIPTAAEAGFHDEATRLFLEAGWLRLFLLRVRGVPAAAVYGFRYRDKVYFYQAGFDPRFAAEGAGTVALALAIRSAIEEGAAEFDLLHGTETYKFHWARVTRGLERLELYPASARGVLCAGGIEMRSVVRAMARRLHQPAYSRAEHERKRARLEERTPWCAD